MLVFSNYVNKKAQQLIDKKEILTDTFQLIKGLDNQSGLFLTNFNIIA